MARRRQEIALQTEIESQEEWNDTVNKEGLTGEYYPIHTSKIIVSFSYIYNLLFLSRRCLSTMGRSM